MSKKLIARFICLSKKDQEWILKNLTNEEASLVRELCNEARVLGLTKDKQFLQDMISESQENTATTESKVGYPSEVLRLDPFWQSIYFNSALTPEASEAFLGEESSIVLDEPIQVSELFARHLASYIGEQKCPD